MDPKLVAIRGPLKGKSFSITGGTFSIGRENTNDLAIDDRFASRRHCLIGRDGESFWIEDRDSSNGTFVNDLPVKKRLLQHGDQIALADSLLVFVLHDDPAVSPLEGVQFEESSVSLQTTYLGHSIYLSGKHRPSEEPRTAQGLTALLEISRALSRLRNRQELQKKLLELVFEVIPAERGAILPLDEAAKDGFTLHFRADEGGQNFRVSRNILDRVLATEESILANSATDNELFRKAPSLLHRAAHSVLCSPLAVFEKMIGVIYLETSNLTALFDQDHLELLSAIASISGPAFESLHRLEQLEEENRRLREDIQIDHSMIGESSAIQKVYEFIAKVAPTDSTVLICGENGTGKELVARAIHRNSPRFERPFVAINCATLTDSLLESELFGHEKGAFTGAIAQKKGKLEIADGGSLFLDEIGELAPSLQAKLLRVLQEREFERVGGVRPIRVDIRLIAATNKDLNQAMSQGAFRPDLYYRLNVVPVEMPPLKERRGDVPLLAQFFAAKHSRRCGRPIAGISPEARTCLLSYDWPGNVRELENAIERAVVLGTGEVILPEDLPEAMLETGAARQDSGSYHEALTQKKKELILNALSETSGNYTEAAKILGLHPNYLHRLIRNLGLRGKGVRS